MCQTHTRSILSAYTASVTRQEYNLLHEVQCFGVHVCSVLYVVWADHRGHSQKSVDEIRRENCGSKLVTPLPKSRINLAGRDLKHENFEI